MRMSASEFFFKRLFCLIDRKPLCAFACRLIGRLDTASDWSFRSAQAGSVSCRESALRMSESELSFKRLSCSSDHEPLTFAGWSSGWTRLRHGRFVPRIGGTPAHFMDVFMRKPWKLGRQFRQDGSINSPSLAVLPCCGRVPHSRMLRFGELWLLNGRAARIENEPPRFSAGEVRS